MIFPTGFSFRFFPRRRHSRDDTRGRFRDPWLIDEKVALEAQRRVIDVDIIGR